MSSTVSANKAKDGVIAFSTVNNVVFPGTSITIDTQKFMLKDNTYNQNYAGFKTAIVVAEGFRRIHMSGDTYIGNEILYLEAIKYYGAIPCTGAYSKAEYKDPVAWKLGAYYITSGDPDTIALWLDEYSQGNFHAIGPLFIFNSFYVHTTGLTFDSNTFPITTASAIYSPKHAGAILFDNIQGEIYLNSLTLQK